MKHLSLFSGIGGIDLAAEWAGFESVAFVERDNFCQQVLSKNFPGVPIFGDVCEFDGTEYENKIDLVSAGFPCQPFSQAGKRQGASDERALWPQVCRILRETKPQWFLGENVPGLLTIDGGQYFGQILNDLAEIGYSAGWIMYGAKDIGAVHRRNRIFIVAHSENESCNVHNVRQSLSYRQKQEQFGGGNSKSSSTNASSVRCERFQEEGSNRQDNQERQEGRQEQLEGGGLRQYACNSESESGPQTDTPTCPERSQRDARENIGSRHWQRIRSGDWKQWGISPTIGIESRVRGSNDGVPNRVDRLKSLGNAVVPQQVYPILVEIARQMK